MSSQVIADINNFAIPPNDPVNNDHSLRSVALSHRSKQLAVDISANRGRYVNRSINPRYVRSNVPVKSQVAINETNTDTQTVVMTPLSRGSMDIIAPIAKKQIARPVPLESYNYQAQPTAYPIEETYEQPVYQADSVVTSYEAYSEQPENHYAEPSNNHNNEYYQEGYNEGYEEYKEPLIGNFFKGLVTKPLSLSKQLFSKQYFSKIKNAIFELTRMQQAIVGMAVVIFIVGAYISFQAAQTNHNAATQIAKLSQQAAAAAGVATTSGQSDNATVPSTVKPTRAAVVNYAVAPNLPKYLNIPAIKVHARVLQVGVLANGALGTPPNVYDTAWYTGSAEPGQQGATLIDGHVSSWTSKGVFYYIHSLKAGDTIQIVKGDNTTVNYQVVKTQVYGSNNVNMQAAITPINPNVSGLNLITCTGQVIRGTSLFNERVIVFAQEVN